MENEGHRAVYFHKNMIYHLLVLYYSMHVAVLLFQRLRNHSLYVILFWICGEIKIFENIKDTVLTEAGNGGILYMKLDKTNKEIAVSLFSL